MTTQQTRPAFRVRWKRGFSTVRCTFYTFWIVVVCLYPFAILIEHSQDAFSSPWQYIVEGGLYVGFLAVACLVPVLVYELKMDPVSITNQLATEVEPCIDAVADALGIDWNQHDISQIGALLENGKHSEARRMYHDHSGETWNQTDRALAAWQTSVVRCKIKALQATVEADKKSTDAPTASLQDE